MRNSKINKEKPIPKNNPLLTDLDDTDPVSKRTKKAELWFEKDSFKEVDEEDDEGVDLDKLAETYREKGLKNLLNLPLLYKQFLIYYLLIVSYYCTTYSIEEFIDKNSK